MDAPDNILQFESKIATHFLSFKRCRSYLKQIGSDFFMREVSDANKLNKVVEIIDEKLDEKEVQSFVAKRLETYEEITNELPALKIWLIPAKGNEEKPTLGSEQDLKGTSELFIVAKFYHFTTDGLSILQMFSLMQDGGDEVKYGSNRVRYPVRPE